MKGIHMSYKKTVVILIPSLNPDQKFVNVVKGISEAGFEHIVCVDDGSREDAGKNFEQVRCEYGCEIIKHCVNMGKGRALKDGFNYIRNQFPDCIGIVTVDGDGQHSVADIEKCAQALLEHSDSLIMGCRSFAKENIPFKSRFGNILTSKLMGILCGIRLSDTQTGLRGIPIGFVDSLVVVSGERFEYEMSMILQAKEMEIPLLEVPIETIYLDDNSSSHFNPVVDSIKIYAQFLKFLVSSFSSFVVDIVLFTLMIRILENYFSGSTAYIVISTVAARIFSAVYNYTINHRKVFHSRSKVNKSLTKYAILAVCQCLVSAGLVSLVFELTGINASAVKIVIDTCLFIFSFQIQREWVFKK